MFRLLEVDLFHILFSCVLCFVFSGSCYLCFTFELIYFSVQLSSVFFLIYILPSENKYFCFCVQKKHLWFTKMYIIENFLIYFVVSCLLYFSKNGIFFIFVKSLTCFCYVLVLDIHEYTFIFNIQHSSIVNIHKINKHVF